MKQIREELISGKDSGHKKFYISREKARFRKVLNEKELICMLKNNGFEIIHAEDFSLSEQIDVFSGCETLLGIHGAGLTNCVFMKQGSNVIELRRKETAKNTGYWHLADCLDHKYYYYNGIPDSEKSIIGRGCNLTIPINDFEEKILKSL
jgi:capsular polysaccharide biosynthesis protein